MKKFLFLIIVVIIAAVTTSLYFCKGSDSNDVVTTTKPKKDIPIDKAFQERIDSFVGHEPWRGTMAMMVYDATAQKVVYAFHEDSLMRPASCMKLLTCVTALRTYGKSMVHHNRLYYSGQMKGDTLVGNLTIKLQFDPFFNRDSLIRMTNSLKQKLSGLRCIKGKVILDMAEYLPMQHEMHWTPGDLKTRMLGLAFLGGYRLRNEMQGALSRIGVSVRRDSIVWGRLPYKKSHLICDITTPLHYSLLKALRNSSNINAECMLYPLGYSISTKGNFRQNGTLKMQEFVKKELHMDPSKTCSIHDGCGLCPDDRISPRLLVALMNYAYQHKYIYNEMMEDLPISGVDGTLHDRLHKPIIMGKIKAKTGTLTREAGISTLTGYYMTKSGHLMIFSIMNNECPVADGRWWQDRFLTKVVLDAVDFPKREKVKDI